MFDVILSAKINRFYSSYCTKIFVLCVTLLTTMLPHKLITASLLTQGFLRVFLFSPNSVISSKFLTHNNLHAALTRRAKPGNVKQALVLRESERNGMKIASILYLNSQCATDGLYKVLRKREKEGQFQNIAICLLIVQI